MGRFARLAMVALLVIELGCSSSSNTTKDEKSDSGPSVDSLVDQRAVPDRGGDAGADIPQIGDLAADVKITKDAPPSCGPGIYPCSPYGIQVGDVVENLTLKGYAYPDYLCKDNQPLNTNALTLVSFKKWYQGDSACPDKRKVLWIMVGAGWCKPCKEEAKVVQALYGAGELDSRIALLSVVVAPESEFDQMTEDFLKVWANNPQFKLAFPTAMDPAQKFSHFADLSTIPYNLVLDLTTMKIIVSGTEFEVADIRTEIDTHLGNL